MWSKIKKLAKKVWRAAKAVVRVVVRVVITIVNNLTLGLPDLLLGFLLWPRKRLRLHVFILSENGVDPDGVEVRVPVVPVQEAQDAVDNAKRIYKKSFNVEVRPYSKAFVEVLNDEAPAEALDYQCSFGSEFGVAGEAGSLWHSGTSTNLMHDGPPAGEHAKWFQQNLLRSSRHVQYW